MAGRVDLSAGLIHSIALGFLVGSVVNWKTMTSLPWLRKVSLSSLTTTSSMPNSFGVAFMPATSADTTFQVPSSFLFSPFGSSARTAAAGSRAQAASKTFRMSIPPSRLERVDDEPVVAGGVDGVRGLVQRRVVDVHRHLLLPQRFTRFQVIEL